MRRRVPALSAADSYSGPNCPAALCGGSKPEDKGQISSQPVGAVSPPRTRWGVGLRSDCPLCVLHCVKTLKRKTYVAELPSVQVNTDPVVSINIGNRRIRDQKMIRFFIKPGHSFERGSARLEP